jgi:hypothetical protein
MSNRIRGGNDWVLSPAESIKVAELADAAVTKAN